VLKEHGIVSVEDLVRIDDLIGIDEYMATLPLSAKLQERLSLGIQMEQLRLAMDAHARRHAAGLTSTSDTPQPVAEPPAISQTPAEIALAKEVRTLERKLRRMHVTQNMLRLAVAPDPFEPVLAEQLAAKLERKAEVMSARIAERHSRSATLGYLDARSKVLDYASALAAEVAAAEAEAAKVAAKEAAQTAAEVEEALAEHAARVAAEEEARVVAAATASQRALFYHARGPPQSRRASLSQREAEIRAALGIREFVNSCARSSAPWMS
jgi:hypothetical protein